MKFNYLLLAYKCFGWFGAIALLSSCYSYKQNIMFRVEDPASISREINKVEKNYVIQKNDYLHIEIYANGGERIIDPDLKLMENISTQGMNSRPDPKYLVDLNGIIKVPMLGELKAEGLTIREMEAILQNEYKKYYTDPYAIITFLNKRVIVLGNKGGSVIPLANENTSLAEILALSQSIDNAAKAQNIRVLRDKEVFLIDFSTVQGYLDGNLIMKPGDIVYVEPIRKPLTEAARDYASIISIITSLAALIIVINNI